MNLLTFEINLVGTHKKIRRKLQITDDYNLNCLHIGIVEMFYLNYESEHEFEYNNQVFLPAVDHDLSELTNISYELSEEMQLLVDKQVDIKDLSNTAKIYLDDCTTLLADLNLQVNQGIEYTNDQQFMYEFTITLVGTNPAKTSKIALKEIKGKFVPYGLDVETYNQIISNPEHSDFQELTNILDDFDTQVISENINSLQPDMTMYR